MLSSIHPLGERSRNNRWGVTVAAFTIAATAVGAAAGALLAGLGSLLGISGETALLVTAGAALGAGILDLTRVTPPGSTRQVNEHWIGYYRGVVYGAAFGAQLGLGIATFVVTWGVYATFVAELVSGSWLSGAAVGLVFGLGRSVTPLLAGQIKNQSTLTSFHQRMDRLGRPTRIASAAGTTVFGMIVFIGAVI